MSRSGPSPAWSTQLRRLALAGRLRPIDVELGIRVGEVAAGVQPGDVAEALGLAALVVSRAVEEGHAAIPVDRLGQACAALEGLDRPPPVQDWAALLRASPLVGSHPEAGTPLVLEHGLLYLQRYAGHEATCARLLRERANVPPDPVTTPRLHPDGDGYLFADARERLGDAPNWQAAACAVALRHRLTVLAGGPGTGKTYTLALIALLLLERAAAAGTPCRIALAAPTGKAAQRLRESVGGALRTFREHFAVRADDLAALEASGSTLHRLLGYRPGSIEFHHHEDNPLGVDCVIVDECSMVDLPLFTRLLRALRPETRLVLVGDRRQLLPVEAGSVFAELFDLCGANTFDRATAEVLRDRCGITPPPATGDAPLDGHVVRLTHSFRAAEGVAAVASAIQRLDAQDPEGLVRIERLFSGPGADIALHTPQRDAVAALVRERCAGEHGWFAALRRARDPAAALAALRGFRILCALRRGPVGVAGLNAAVEQALLDGLPPEENEHLRPIMVTRNDERMKLYNGDVGVLFRGEDGVTRCWFEAGGAGAIRSVLPAQLPPHETAYAMTIHKSQGSEFERVLVVLPETVAHERALLTRELVYTGITRAKAGVEVWSTPDVLRGALARESRRDSGLAARFLAGAGSPAAGRDGGG